MCAAKLMGIFKKCLSTQDKKQHVVYFPGTEYDRGEMALPREHEPTLHPLHAGFSDLGGDAQNLPVSIPISHDGEEGYRQAQQRLIHSKNLGCDRAGEGESVHAPPNKIVYDCESPPPYRSRRFTHPTTGDGNSVDAKHRTGAAGAVKKPTQVITSNGGSPVVRCYNGGLSNNNNANNVNLNSSSSACGVVGGALPHHPPHQYHRPHVYTQTGAASHIGHLRAPNNHHHRRRESPSSGHSRHSSSSSTGSLGSPPNYNDVIANNFTTRHSNGSDV